MDPWQPEVPPPSVPRDKSPEALVGDITALLASGQNAVALVRAEALRKLHPNHVPGLLVLARVLTKNRRFRDAQSVCADAQTRDRKNPECFEVLAEIFQAEGQTDTAAGLRQQAVKLRSGRRT
jgi:predicted Zn-dependent protease